MDAERMGTDYQGASAARGLKQDAGSEWVKEIEARHKGPSAFDGRFLRQRRGHGYDRARWRGLWRVQIQEYLIGAVQNHQVLLK